MLVKWGEGKWLGKWRGAIFLILPQQGRPKATSLPQSKKGKKLKKI